MIVGHFYCDLRTGDTFECVSINGNTDDRARVRRVARLKALDHDAIVFVPDFEFGCFADRTEHRRSIDLLEVKE